MLEVFALTLVASCQTMPATAIASTMSAQSPSVPATASQDDNLEPDRPDVTNGTHIVDAGLLQMEVGGVWNRSGAGRSVGTPLTVRVGLTEWLEARVSGDGFLSVTDAAGNQRGMGNVQLGAKLRLWSDPGGVPVLSILPTINLPVASERKGLGSGQADFTIAILTGTDLLTRGHLDVNYGIGRIGAGTGLPRFTQHLVSWSASAEVPGPLTPYLEGFWFSRQDPEGGQIAALDTGAIYVINQRLALDGGVQVGLTSAAPALSAFGGMSVVLGNVLGAHGVHARQRETARRAAARRATGRR
jgi:outer membrane putative beta-barrel porin/alpha-amylase